MELNAAHPIVVNLNQLRKTNKAAAKLVAEQFLDNVMVQSGIPFDLQHGTARQFKLIASYLELIVGQDQPALDSGNAGGASRAKKAPDSDEAEVI